MLRVYIYSAPGAFIKLPVAVTVLPNHHIDGRLAKEGIAF